MEKEKKDLGDSAQSSGPGYPLQSSTEDGERISATIPIAEETPSNEYWTCYCGEDLHPENTTGKCWNCSNEGQLT